MKCRECRDGYDRWLNEGRKTQLAADVRRHTESCPKCGPYTRTMSRLDLALRHAARESAPLPEIPPSLVMFVETLCDLDNARRSAPRWSQYVRPAATYILPGICLWLVSLILPGTWRVALHLVMIIACTLVLLMSPHRPRLFV